MFRNLYPRRVKQGLRLLHSERRLYRMPLRQAATFSTLFHVFGPIALVAFLLFVLRMPLWDWLKPKTTSSDLTFVLVHDTNTPPPKQAQFRGNANQHAGGKRNPNKPLTPTNANPAGGSGKVVVHKSASPKLSKVSSPAPVKPVAQAVPSDVKSQPVKPAIETPGKPEAIAEVVQLDPDQVSGGSLSGSLDGLAPAAGGSGIGASTGAGSDEGSQGNAQGGGGAPGVDVMQDADFGPFMAELEKRIKKHWVPPRGSDSRKVLLLFYLARDGKLVKIETKKTSGDEETDRAAMAAIEQSTPFLPFPPEVKEDVLPIEFTFDYNVLNPKKTKRGLRW